MCGIVGFINGGKYGFDAKGADVMETMLFLDTQRGWDSTGTFGVQKNGNMYMAKDAVHGADFISTKEFKDIRNKMIASGQFWVGHNRWATRGEIVDKNAHPFVVEDNIILVQNGTMRGDHKKHKNVEVDTEAIAHVIHETGDIEEALNKIDASYALVWYNVKSKTLHMIRNNERPLFTAKTKDSNSVLFASEENMILYAAYKHELKLAAKPTILPAYMLHSYTLEDGGGYKFDENIVRIRPKEVVLPNGNFPHFGRHYGEHSSDDDDGVWQGWPNRSHGHNRHIQQAVQESMSQRRSNVVVLPGVNIEKDSPNDINVDFNSYVFSKYPQFHLTSEDKNNCTNKAAADGRNDTPAIIQLEDYFHANNNDNCRVWFVFGRDINPANSEMLFFWIVHGKEEMEILQMVSDDIYYQVKPSNYQVRQSIINNEPRYLVTRFCNEKTVVVMDDHQEAQVVH